MTAARAWVGIPLRLWLNQVTYLMLQRRMGLKPPPGPGRTLAIAVAEAGARAGANDGFGAGA